jgi:hypothetical protein
MVLTLTDIDQKWFDEFSNNYMQNQNEKDWSTERIKERVREIYIRLASSFVLESHPLIVIEKGWDVSEIWGMSSYSDVLTEIVDSQLKKDDSEKLTDIIGTNLLNRDNEEKRLVLPESIQAILVSILTDFENLNIITNIDSILQHNVGFRAECVVSDSDLMDCMFYTAWSIFFQLVSLYPQFDFQNPLDKTDLRERLARIFDPQMIKVVPYFDSRMRHLMEDQIIMYINGSYSEIIDICLQAIVMYRAGDRVNSNSNPTVNSIHSQIIQMAR